VTRALLAFVLLALAAPPLRAQQDTARVRPVPTAAETPVVRADTAAARRPSRPDSVRPRPPVSPGGAFIRSLLIPGWGQSALGRDLAGGLFVAFEGVAITMAWKSDWQRDFAVQRGQGIEAPTQEREDWLVLVAFNHLFSAAEAYVAAHLWDFPAGLKFRAAPGPGGGTVVGASLPLP
jgi:hypothetical protein